MTDYSGSYYISSNQAQTYGKLNENVQEYVDLKTAAAEKQKKTMFIIAGAMSLVLLTVVIIYVKKA